MLFSLPLYQVEWPNICCISLFVFSFPYRYHSNFFIFDFTYYTFTHKHINETHENIHIYTLSFCNCINLHIQYSYMNTCKNISTWLYTYKQAHKYTHICVFSHCYDAKIILKTRIHIPTSRFVLPQNRQNLYLLRCMMCKLWRFKPKSLNLLWNSFRWPLIVSFCRQITPSLGRISGFQIRDSLHEEQFHFTAHLAPNLIEKIFQYRLTDSAKQKLTVYWL